MSKTNLKLCSYIQSNTTNPNTLFIISIYCTKYTNINKIYSKIDFPQNKNEKTFLSNPGILQSSGTNKPVQTKGGLYNKLKTNCPQWGGGVLTQGSSCAKRSAAEPVPLLGHIFPNRSFLHAQNPKTQDETQRRAEARKKAGRKAGRTGAQEADERRKRTTNEPHHSPSHPSRM